MLTLVFDFKTPFNLTLLEVPLYLTDKKFHPAGISAIVDIVVTPESTI
jgi:hypothetical protein